MSRMRSFKLPADDGSATWRRRDVLIAGSAAAVAFWVEGFPGARHSEAAAPRSLSVGYVLGSHAWPDLRALPWSASGTGAGSEPIEVVPASRATGDVLLAATAVDRARVSVRGLYPGLPSPGEVASRSIRLDVLFPDPGIGERVAFHAWSFEQGEPPKVSPPITFEVPLDEGVVFAVTADPGDLPGIRAKAARDRGAAPQGPVLLSGLRLGTSATTGLSTARGTYLLGLGTGSWDRGGVLQPSLDALVPALLSIVVTVDPIAAEATS